MPTVGGIPITGSGTVWNRRVTTTSASRPPIRPLVRAVAAALALLFLLACPVGSARAQGRSLPTPSERMLGERVAAAALGRLGTPYAWGGGSPDGPTVGFCDGVNGYLGTVCMADHTTGFDCSGLAMYAWYRGSDGAVDLPHHAADQLTVSRAVPLDQLIPGDLLFFALPGGPVHHVGIYVGNGAMVQAEHTGTVVSILPHVARDPKWAPQLIAAARPVPPHRAPAPGTPPWTWAPAALAFGGDR